MKCSNCGGINFKEVGLDKLLSISGDARLNEIASVSICLNCGHLEFFNHYYVNDYKNKVDMNEKINKEIKEKNEKIEDIKSQKFDPMPYQKEINRLKEEIKTLQSLGVGGKDIRAREESIKDNEKVLVEKVDPNNKRTIEQLEYEIYALKKAIIQID